MARIFISYKRVDKDKVFRIKGQIESAIGEKCWIDLDGIESDAQFKNVIIKAINECEIVLFMYSKAHSKIVDFEKDWTVRELNFAQKKNKRIVFVNLDGSPLTDTFEFDYGTKQQIDALSQQAILRLISDLKKWLGKLHVQYDVKPKIHLSQKTKIGPKQIIHKQNKKGIFSTIENNKKHIVISIIGVIIVSFGSLVLNNNIFTNTADSVSDELGNIALPSNTALCPKCNGTGQYSGSICTVCSGNGYTSENAIVSEEEVEEIIMPQNGWYYYDDGTFAEAKIPDKKCVGVIFGVGMTSEEEKKRGFKIGYIMALHDACEYAVNWGDYGYQTKTIYRTKSSAVSDFEGYYHSFLEGKKEEGDRIKDEYSAFYHASSYSVKLPVNTSGWYLPSVGQWNMFLKDVLYSSFGEKWNDNAKDKLKEMHFKTAFYWTSTDFGYTSDDPGHEYGDAWNIELSISSCATLHTYCRGFVGLSRSIAAF